MPLRAEGRLQAAHAVPSDQSGQTVIRAVDAMNNTATARADRATPSASVEGKPPH